MKNITTASKRSRLLGMASAAFLLSGSVMLAQNTIQRGPVRIDPATTPTSFPPAMPGTSTVPSGTSLFLWDTDLAGFPSITLSRFAYSGSRRTVSSWGMAQNASALSALASPVTSSSDNEDVVLNVGTNGQDLIIANLNPFGGSDDGAIRFSTTPNGASVTNGPADVERMTITNSGDIGINQPVPLARLHVQGGGGLIVRPDANHAAVMAVTDDQAGSWWNFANTNNGEKLMITTGDHHNSNETTDWNGSLFTFTSNGEMGVGTTAPGDRFHLNEGAFRISKQISGATTDAQMAIAQSAGLYSNFSAAKDLVIRSLNNSNGMLLTTNSSTGQIRFGTGSDVHRMSILSNGNVYMKNKLGIGTDNPASALHLYSADNPTVLRLQSTGSFGGGRVELWSGTQGDANEWRPSYIESTDDGSFTGGLAFYTNGTGSSQQTGSLQNLRLANGFMTVGTGTWNPGYKLFVNEGQAAVRSAENKSAVMTLMPYGNGAWWNIANVRTNNGSGTEIDRKLVIGTGDPHNYGDNESNWANAALTIRGDGNVGIGGVINPNEKLVVKGVICAEEIKVAASTNMSSSCWPDYVFDEHYKLMPLSELEQAIRRQSHLPNIPSAAEVEAQGIHLGDMQMKLLQKVEELTLYAIDQEKRMADQEQRLRTLETENQRLRDANK